MSTANSNQQFPSLELINEILQVKGSFENDEIESECSRMIESLTAEELNLAANTSYCYWVKEMIYHNNNNNNNDNNTAGNTNTPTEENKIKHRMAMREARRHYLGNGSIFEIAVKKLKSTLQWRKERHVDLFRACVCVNNLETIPMLSDNDKVIIHNIRKLLKEDMQKQPMAVRGHDRLKHSILVKQNRILPSYPTDLESYVTSTIFLCEKGIAINEVFTKGHGEQSISIFDFSELTYTNLPPWKLRLTAMQMLEEHYPERAAMVYILDSPYWFRAVYAIASPFLSVNNRQKVSLLNGVTEKTEALESIIDCDQAMPFMLSEGKLTSPIDVERVMNQPFHFLYDNCE